MKQKNFLFVICFAIFSCSTDELSNCTVVKVNFGYSSAVNEEPLYYEEYFFTHESETHIKVEKVKIESGKLFLVEHYYFDDQERLIKVIKRDLVSTFANGETREAHVDFTFSNNFMTLTSYDISNHSDTINKFEIKYLYLNSPTDNKVYRFTNPHGWANSYKFENGNLFEAGTFEVVNKDTIDAFYSRFFYDNHPNTFNVPSYRAAGVYDFYDARVTSKNNFIEVYGIDSEITFRYNYNYDSDGKLIRYWGKSGLTLDFKYDCN